MNYKNGEKSKGRKVTWVAVSAFEKKGQCSER